MYIIWTNLSCRQLPLGPLRLQPLAPAVPRHLLQLRLYCKGGLTPSPTHRWALDLLLSWSYPCLWVWCLVAECLSRRTRLPC